MVEENTDAGANIEKPVSATDADNDILIYELSGTVSINSIDVDADTLFDINTATGQLKTKADLNFEGGTDNNPAANDAGLPAYEVTVTATDPSGADAIQTVTITLTDANESSAFTAGESVLTDVNVLENLAQLRQGEDGTDNLTGTDYAVDDPDAADTVEPVLTLEGADAKYFDISPQGELTIDQDQVENDERSVRLPTELRR